MRGAWSLTIVMSLAAAITMFQMAGLGVWFGGPGGFQTDDALEDNADRLDPNEEGVQGSASEQEGSIVGLIVDGSTAIFTFIGAVVLLPAELSRLGAPWWLAYPIGLVLQLHASIAGIQFTVNRVLE